MKTAIAQTRTDEYLPADAWVDIYFRLWAYTNIFGVERTYAAFADIIDIMKEAGKLYDPKLQLPCTEYGFFKNDQVKIPHPLLPTQTVIIFGGHRNRRLHAEYGEKVAYTVNIDDGTFYGGSPGSLEADMFADMNNADQLRSLPSEHFDKIIIESVPVIDYFSPVFFQNANRLLKIGGILEANTLYGLSGQSYKTQENGKLIRNNRYGAYYLSCKQVITYLARFGFEPCDYDTKKIKKNQQALIIDDKTHYYDYWYAVHHIYVVKWDRVNTLAFRRTLEYYKFYGIPSWLT